MSQNLTDYEEFVKVIANLQAVVDGDHILATRGNPSNFRVVFENLLESVYDFKLNVIAKRTCHYRNCINPSHFSISFKQKQDMSQEERDDLKILIEDIDFDKVKEIGMEKYLEEYNEGLPEELKISLQTLKICVKIHG